MDDLTAEPTVEPQPETPPAMTPNEARIVARLMTVGLLRARLKEIVKCGSWRKSRQIALRAIEDADRSERGE
jgi:hypothetical protein